jgi:hypothetical protein
LAPGKFDYQFLRFSAGRYGTQALAALTHAANATWLHARDWRRPPEPALIPPLGKRPIPR